MQWQKLIIDGYERVLEILDRTLYGLTQDDLNWRPQPGSNSIGWLAWHISREQDYNISRLIRVEQLWIINRWYVRFNRAPNPLDTGYEKLGHSSEDAADFRSPGTDILLGYYSDVLERSKSYIKTLLTSDLNQEASPPAWSWERQRQVETSGSQSWYIPVPTVGMRLISILSECLQHAGQASYIRGLLQGKGWLKE